MAEEAQANAVPIEVILTGQPRPAAKTASIPRTRASWRCHFTSATCPLRCLTATRQRRGPSSLSVTPVNQES